LRRTAVARSCRSAPMAYTPPPWPDFPAAVLLLREQWWNATSNVWPAAGTGKVEKPQPSEPGGRH
jgi:hypothetical protein